MTISVSSFNNWMMTLLRIDSDIYSLLLHRHIQITCLCRCRLVASHPRAMHVIWLCIKWPWLAPAITHAHENVKEAQAICRISLTQDAKKGQASCKNRLPLQKGKTNSENKRYRIGLARNELLRDAESNTSYTTDGSTFYVIVITSIATAKLRVQKRLIN